MSSTADMLIERRRLRRRLALWRVLAILAVVAAVLVVLGEGAGPPLGDHLARVKVEGIITDEPRRSEMFEQLAENDSVRGVILRINSPGGTVVGAEALYEDLRRLARAKPVVAVLSDAAASGGYIAALASDHIIARGNTLTGSIGVVAEIPNIAGLLEMVGVGVTRVKSGPLKGEPSLTTPPDETVIAAQEALIADAYEWFRGLVAERRELTGSDLDAVADGRVFTGRQALERGLIDAIGDERTARAWLAEAHGIGEDTRIVDYDWDQSRLGWPLDSVEGTFARLLGRGPVVSPGPRLYAVIQQ